MQVTTSPVGWRVDGYTVLKRDTGWLCTCGVKMCPHVIATIKYKVDQAGLVEPVYTPAFEQAVPLPPAERPMTTEQWAVIQQAEMEGADHVTLLTTLAAISEVGATTPHQSASASPSDPLACLNVEGQPPLPAWLTALHDHQWDAIHEACDLFDRGVKVVFMDAPTGSGKTLIGEGVRRMLTNNQSISKALYVCSDRALQDQFLADFDYAHVLKGRANYPTLNGSSEVTCGDCTKNGPDSKCNWCDNTSQCPYLKAKMTALKSPVAVLNTAYLLAEANSAGSFAGRGLTIMDECDVLEQVLMGYVEYKVPERTLKRVNLEPPKKGSHWPTIIKWAEDELLPRIIELHATEAAQNSMFGADLKVQRDLKALARLIESTKLMLKLARQGDNWVRDNDAGPLVLKPIKVDEYGHDRLWKHSERWLCMSATIISPEQMAESLGIRGGEGEEGGWGTVSVPMTFPVENRQIRQIPIANMVYKEKETAWPEMVEGIRKVVSLHPTERVLVHAVSYALASEITSGLSGTGRRVVTYRSTHEKEAALRDYRRTPNAILVASSMDRGVDLKDDDCRVVIVAKVPFPSLKDSQVSKRMHMSDGGVWYAVQTVRSIVQMTGRGVRSKTDWAVTYILDAQFGTNIYAKSQRLFPAWWRAAIRFTPKSHFMNES